MLNERDTRSSRNVPQSWVRRAWPLALGPLVGALVWSFGPDTFTLEHYTDHLRHEYAAWAFLQVGLRVWSEPLAAWGVTTLHPHLLWERLPYS
ncbi:MAG: hypothetical protein ACRD1R_17590, partial [Acidobacteriota bacterium]